MSVRTKLLLAQMDVGVRVIKIETFKWRKPRVTLEVAGEIVTVTAGDSLTINVEGKYTHEMRGSS